MIKLLLVPTYLSRYQLTVQFWRLFVPLNCLVSQLSRNIIINNPISSKSMSLWYARQCHQSVCERACALAELIFCVQFFLCRAVGERELIARLQVDEAIALPRSIARPPRAELGAGLPPGLGQPASSGDRLLFKKFEVTTVFCLFFEFRTYSGAVAFVVGCFMWVLVTEDIVMS